MKKIEASTLEEAYIQASKELECSISDLEYEVMQYPSSGILGLLKKNAIIVASCSKKSTIENDIEDVATEIVNSVKEREVTIKEDQIVDAFFNTSVAKNKINSSNEESEDKEPIVYNELAKLIENSLKDLFEKACFDIDVIEVDVRDNTALIFIDGNDAALLIGKEGYRYNALSYMLFNWLHSKYELFIKLEIAEFLTTQQKMISNYIKPVIQTVETEGKGKTRFLDGILVQIALEQLRERFPNKYVAVKSSKEGKKFVVINDFNSNSYE
ncbi:MAG: RNA-binding protein Jag [uncultured Sulfurovum sp.]|uniref:RNA-binding protein Jag n=1 Tax=uncultured Sulfurovum sp. TaxID=269237 RepID=A0A6S6UFN6_9BACT|nr:MAG: RNA-binding protein Jag [uncultured Sulfurovum sp.]